MLKNIVSEYAGHYVFVYGGLGCMVCRCAARLHVPSTNWCFYRMQPRLTVYFVFRKWTKFACKVLFLYVLDFNYQFGQNKWL